MLESFRKKADENTAIAPASDEAAAAKARLARLPEIAREFGVKTSKCPSCGAQLAKFPKRKIKCKNCEQPVYPRENPVTSEVVLIPEAGFDRLQELNAYASGTWESWFSNYYEIETIRAQLAAEWGLDDASKVPVADAEWRRITIQASRSFANSDWPAYLSARGSSIRFLSDERRYKEAVPLACEYIYLTYNVDRMQRAYEALGLPKEMRKPLTPLKMHGPQIVMVDFVEPDIDRLREAYADEMAQTGLHRLFGMAPEEAFELYRQERDEHYEALRDHGSLEGYLESIARSRSKAR